MNMEKLSVPIAIVIAGAIIGGALYYSNIKVDKSGTKLNIPKGVKTEMKPISASDHILGNPNADIIIVEYSDTECPFCKSFHATLKRVMTEYGKDGKVAWVYRHFPIESLHSKAPKEAEATECANELGGPEKFWQYVDTIYERTDSNDSLDPAELPRIAKDVGLDVAKFNECLSSGRYEAFVQASYEDAVKAGGKGTPNSIAVSKDGTQTVIQGAQSYSALKQIIDALLEK